MAEDSRRVSWLQAFWIPGGHQVGAPIEPKRWYRHSASRLPSENVLDSVLAFVFELIRFLLDIGENASLLHAKDLQTSRMGNHALCRP
jgi:hypothetical protein